MLSPTARILAAADVYHAMTEPRPHRPALSPEAAAEGLRQEARAGKLDSEAVSSVLAAAGHRVRPSRREMVAGLTAREIEVLRLVTQGLTTTHIAEQLIISPRTADAHVRSIYSKLEVTSRAAATRAAIEHQLI